MQVLQIIWLDLDRSVIDYFLGFLQEKNCGFPLKHLVFQKTTIRSVLKMACSIMNFQRNTWKTLQTQTTFLPAFTCSLTCVCWTGYGWSGDWRRIRFGSGHCGAPGEERSIGRSPGSAFFWWFSSGCQSGGPLCLRACWRESNLHLNTSPFKNFISAFCNEYRSEDTTKELEYMFLCFSPRWPQRQTCRRQCLWRERSSVNWTWQWTVPASQWPLKPTTSRRTSHTAWRTSSASST